MPEEIPEVERERWYELHQLEEWLEKPMLVLSVAWLALVVVEFTQGLSRAMQTAGWVIWGVFVLDFVLRFVLAPRKREYLHNNVLTAVSLIVPALRVLRIFRAMKVLQAARAVRGVRLVKVVGTLNRGMRSLGRTFSRRGVGYVVALTIVVVLTGAAGMLSFERGVPGGTIGGYWDAVWWTSMIMTTMGSDYFPRTPEGRFLCVILALYAFAVFGYVTATLATFFIDSDAKDPEAELFRELRAIREQIEALHVRATTP
ncbi:MAG: potassium channel family protein [Gemmatimonadaceae bacterium]|nr:potassium channel family protein [Gemmatimonadaceae bacterium]